MMTIGRYRVRDLAKDAMFLGVTAAVLAWLALAVRIAISLWDLAK